MVKVLFICSQNKLRSPTAEQVFSKDRRLEVRSAGVDRDADCPLSSEDLEWADVIFVMEKTHQRKISRNYRSSLRGKRVICLNIPDEYDFMDPALVALLETSVPRHLGTY